MRLTHSSPAHMGIGRRAFLRLVGLWGSTAIIAACSTSTPPGMGEPVTVIFWTPGGGGDFCARFDTIATDFHTQYPNIQIGPTQCGAGDQEFTEVLFARIAAGNPPDA